MKVRLRVRGREVRVEVTQRAASACMAQLVRPLPPQAVDSVASSALWRPLTRRTSAPSGARSPAALLRLLATARPPHFCA